MFSHLKVFLSFLKFQVVQRVWGKVSLSFWSGPDTRRGSSLPQLQLWEGAILIKGTLLVSSLPFPGEFLNSWVLIVSVKQLLSLISLYNFDWFFFFFFFFFFSNPCPLSGSCCASCWTNQTCTVSKSRTFVAIILAFWTRGTVYNS